MSSVSRNVFVEVPPWLNINAALEFKRVVLLAKNLLILDKINFAVLAIYADCYDKYFQAINKVQEFGVAIEVKGEKLPSPFITIAEKMASQILLCSAKLGFPVTDSLKLILPLSEEKNVISHDKNKYSVNQH